jgi:hypothetical protein
MLPIVSIDQSKKTITMTLPLQQARPSKSSGKTLVIASTHGCQVTDAKRLGRPVFVTANFLVYAAEKKRVKGSKTRPATKSGLKKPRVLPAQAPEEK